MKKNKTAVLVLGFNNKNFLEDCFNSLLRAKREDIDLIYIDNGSVDNSVQFVQKIFPKIIIWDYKKNFGFAEGYNKAIKKALKNNYDYLFLLNPDTVISSLSLKKLIAAANNRTILQPLILLRQKGRKTQLVNTTGSYLNFLGISYCNDFLKNKKNILDKEIAAASGAAMLVPTIIFKKIGFFDKNFFMYHEDLDFCWRARMAGFNVKLLADAIVWHDYSFGRNFNKLFFAERNRQMFMFKNYQFRTLFFIFPAWFFSELAVIFLSIFQGWFFVKMRAYFSLIKLLPKIFKERQKIQANRLVGDRKLKKFVGGEISFSEFQNKLIGISNKISIVYWQIIKKLI